MGWFSSIFRKKEELEKAYIDLGELEQWFDMKSESLLEGIKESIKEDISSINTYLAKLKESSKALEEAKLRNDNIPERAVQIMEGNRRAYISAINNFAGSIQLPAIIKFDAVSDFVSDFEDRITSFTKISARNYHILQEFFAHESNQIAQSVKDIDLAVRGLLDNDYKKVDNVLANIARLKEMVKRKETAGIMLTDYEKERYEILKTIEKINADTEGMKKTRDYRLLQEAERKRDEIKRQIRENEKRLFEMLAPLERPMKKFSKISQDDEKLILGYLESPLESLSVDKDLKILSLMPKIKDSIEKGELELKDKAKEKAIAQIGFINEAAIRDITAKNSMLIEAQADNENSLKMNMAIQKQNEAEYRIGHLKDKLAKLDANIEKLGRFLETEGIEGLLVQIKKDILDVTNTDLKIKVKDKII